MVEELVEINGKILKVIMKQHGLLLASVLLGERNKHEESLGNIEEALNLYTDLEEPIFQLQEIIMQANPGNIAIVGMAEIILGQIMRYQSLIFTRRGAELAVLGRNEEARKSLDIARELNPQDLRPQAGKIESAISSRGGMPNDVLLN